MSIAARDTSTLGIGEASGLSRPHAGSERLETLARDVADLDRALGDLAQPGDVAGDAAQRLRANLAAFEPAVTFLGQVKSGKTSLINAVAGWSDLLPTDVNPWTSVVTSLHLSPALHRAETGACFRFLTEDEWDRLTRKGGRIGELAGRAGAEGELAKIRAQINAMRAKSRDRLGRNFELLMGQSHDYGYFDKNLLERYICLGDEGEDADASPPAVIDPAARQGRFADITRSADLYLNCRAVPFRLCLRDTPGVNDTFMMREMVTISALRDARVCVVVLSATQALSTSDMALLRMLSTLRARGVVLFVNRIDELPDPPAQMVEIEESVRATITAHDGPANAEIVFGSAHWANTVLTGRLDRMHPASADALLALTRAVLGSTRTDLAPADLIWEMSGLPRLMRAVSTRIAEDLGAPLLRKTAASALALATSLDATEQIVVAGVASSGRVDPAKIAAIFDQTAQAALGALEREMDAVIAEYQTRADRIHANFVDRAVHALLDHLERYGDREIWTYDPARLRVLLRAAYSAMGQRMAKLAAARYEAVARDLAHLLHQGFGAAVEGIAIAIPEVPPIPPPVALSQSIALDFNDRWWALWWRRMRGGKAVAQQFDTLIRAETCDFMTQMKEVQTTDIRTALRAELSAFLDDQRAVIAGLLAGRPAPCPDRDPAGCAWQQAREKAQETLRRFTP